MAVFTTVLTADLSASDEIAHVASNDGARTTYEWRATIEDEVVYVFSGVAEGLDWGIRRGRDDTDPVAHFAGVTLTAVRVRGSVPVSETLTEDGSSPVADLTDEGGIDWLTSDVVEGA